jgi:MoaD family protein
MAKVKVRVFHELRSALGQSELELEVDTLNDLLRSLISKHRNLREVFFDLEGELRTYILFYVNNALQSPPDLSKKLNDGDLVLLIPPAAGG